MSTALRNALTELERWKAATLEATAQANFWRQQHDLVVVRAEKAEALAAYAQHKNDCRIDQYHEWKVGEPRPCSCGLAAFLATPMT